MVRYTNKLGEIILLKINDLIKFKEIKAFMIQFPFKLDF